MPRGRPTPPIRLDCQGRDQLRSIARSRSQPHGMVQRARIVLACAEGESHVAIASRLGISKMTVGKWRRRYLEQGIEGLQDEERPGRPRTHDDERVAEVINTALHSKPPQGTHWSVRTMAEHTGRAFPNLRYIVGSRCLVSNRIVSVTSRSQTILSLWRKCVIL